MSGRSITVVACLLALQWLAAIEPATAQSVVEQNSNVVGQTLPGYYRGIPAMQDNEASCAINPILPRNTVCAWNGSGGSDDKIGDTWIRFSESLDGGRTFFNRYLNGSALKPASSASQQFAADPVMMCWPGGCGTVMLAATRAPGGGTGGGIYIQWMMDMNTEAGFRKAFKVSLDRVYRSTGSHFADKPHALYILDEDNPGTLPVTMDVEMPDGSVQSITRSWPNARIIVVFSLFNSSKNDVEIMSTYTDDYGANWSNPRQVAQTSGQDQGVSLAAIGNTVFYGFRRFANGSDTSAMMGVVSTNKGERFSKPFKVTPDICAYDVPTLPSTLNRTAAAARTNDFPWVSQNGSKFIMVYSDRLRASNGSCITDGSAPSDSRIMAMVGSASGKNWYGPFDVAPNPGHGFQFMPVVDCSLGVCQVAWWDSLRDSLRTRDFLMGGTLPAEDAEDALTAFVNLPILADFNFPVGDGSRILRFRRTADMYTKKVRIDGNTLDVSEPATMASRYRLVPHNGVLVEREFNPFNVKAYKTNTVPFMSDYSSITSIKHRFVFNPDVPSQAPYWESNAGPHPLANTEDPLDPLNNPLFWLAWTDARNMRGQIYTSEIDGQPPFARTQAVFPLPEAESEPEQTVEYQDETNTDSIPGSLTPMNAESVEDSNPLAGECPWIEPGIRPGAGGQFTALNNRVKDSDIYGALIENRATAWSLNPTKTLGSIQRTYVIVAENEDELAGRKFRFEIENQPIGYDESPRIARASWNQLPWDLDDSNFQNQVQTGDPALDEESDVITYEAVGPQSSASIALFLVSKDPVNPVSVRITDVTGLPAGVPGTLINTIVVNGSVESGPLVDSSGNANDWELHSPLVYAPDPSDPTNYNSGHYNDPNNPVRFTPDLYNPDLYNPDLYNPDLYNPDLYNPDLYNPDLYNPDLYNPDLYNPDLYNPDLYNPDLYNPDLYNLNLFNTNLTDSDQLHNPEIPELEGGSFSYNEGEVCPPDTICTVSKIDVQFGVQNDGNTLTPYTVDFALANSDVLALIEGGEVAAQVIAWQNKQIDDYQFCGRDIVTENRVIAAKNNPDLSELTIPEILDNRAGALTYFVAPGDILQMTLRFVGPTAKIVDVVEPALRDDIISWVFTAQTADTGLSKLRDTNDQVVNNLMPATFSINIPSQMEAQGPNGVQLPPDFITASRNDEDAAMSCNFSAGQYIPLDSANTPEAPTVVECTATTSNGIMSSLSTSISVRDDTAPTITTVLNDISTEASTSGPNIVPYGPIVAVDDPPVDSNPVVFCDPPSGSEFTFAPPSPWRKDVTCYAEDFEGNRSADKTFDVILTDTQIPVFVNLDNLTFVPPSSDWILPEFNDVLHITWGPIEVSDADPNLSLTCEPGTPTSSPEFTFEHDFQWGPTSVTCTATDGSGQSAMEIFLVTIEDNTEPVIELLGENPLTLDMGSPYVESGATALDNGKTDLTANIVIDDSEVDTSTAGTYNVYYTVDDGRGNETTVTRTVVVEFSYGMTGIIPSKTSVKVGSSNPLRWAWLDADDNPMDSSADKQYLRIENCDTGVLAVEEAGDPGSSTFRFKADNWWQFNWDSTVVEDGNYCAYVTSGRTWQEMGPQRQIRVRL